MNIFRVFTLLYDFTNYMNLKFVYVILEVYNNLFYRIYIYNIYNIYKYILYIYYIIYIYYILYIYIYIYNLNYIP